MNTYHTRVDITVNVPGDTAGRARAIVANRLDTITEYIHLAFSGVNASIQRIWLEHEATELDYLRHMPPLYKVDVQIYTICEARSSEKVIERLRLVTTDLASMANAALDGTEARAQSVQIGKPIKYRGDVIYV